MDKLAEESTDEVPRSLRGEGTTELKRPSHPPQPKAVNLRCIWSTRVIVPAERTITKTRYQFDAGQVLAVDSLDVPGLLALERQQSPGCCGGDPNPPPLKFFERA